MHCISVSDCSVSRKRVEALHWTLSVARVTWLKKSIDTDKREHGYGANHGAQLYYRSAPHEGAVALIPQNNPDDDLHIGQGENEEDPGQHLQSEKRWVL